MWNHIDFCINHIKNFSQPTYVWINRYGTLCFGESFPNKRYTFREVGIYKSAGFDEQDFLEDVDMATPSRKLKQDNRVNYL